MAFALAVMLVITGGVLFNQEQRKGTSGATAPVASRATTSVPSPDSTTPASTTVPPSAPTIIGAGDVHGCVVTASGGLTCWGDNTHGQIGDGTTTIRLTPRAVTGLASGVQAVTTGAEHTCAVTAAGEVTCWGKNNSGQLGDDSEEDQTSPVAVVGLDSGVRSVAAGTEHTCAVTSGGAVLCWGDNTNGQLGDGTTSLQSTPVQVGGLRSGVRAVAAGAEHSCAVTDDGTVWCWGRNTSGQLGDGTTEDHSTPVAVVGLGAGAQAISAGGAHTCALTSGGALKCWGSNTYGKLGAGYADQSSPVDVVGLGAGVQAISAGADHTCAVTAEGALKCWGSNTYGQLGDGSVVDQSTPVDVVGLGSGVRGVSAGRHHTCAMTITGKVDCWGANDNGQLGDGTLPVDWSNVTLATDTLADWYAGVCKGRKVAVSARYGGKSHPLVILGPGSDRNNWAVTLAGKNAPKALHPSGIEKVQLVVCITEKVTLGPACGTYVRSSDNVRGTLRRRKDVVTVRIVVASTGKEIRRNTFTRMPTCPTRTSVGSAAPPWYLNTLYVSAKTTLPYVVRFTKGSVLR
ncbi:MAG: hypothetical protein WAS07_01425 [Micropruina sp.]